MSEINVVPYIDVMLVLLVIFMVTAPLFTQGVEVALPKVPSDPVDPAQLEDPLIVSMKADGAIYINLGPTEEGSRVTIDALEHQAGKVLAARSDAPVFLRADHRLDYGRVVAVMTALQRAGAASVGLITEAP
ncbi:MAG: protein TolR [Pseudomonadales bacterium]